MNSIIKTIFIIGGSISLVLGVLGIFLPLLPATPFLLLASFCYLKGSERLHERLLKNRLLGGYIRSSEQGRGIPKRAKIVTLIMVWISLLYSMTRVEMIILKVLLPAIAVALSVFLVRMKTAEEETIQR